MALFGKNKKQDAPAREKAPAAKAPAAKAVKTPAAKAAQVSSGSLSSNLGSILRNPRITEKATTVQGMGVYTFDVATNATKREIIAAVRSLYRVTPRKVAVVPVPKKMRRNARTGKLGASAAGRKAYVYLKAGETITIS